MEIITIISAAVGLLGLALAYIQFRALKSVESMVDTQMASLLNRVRSMVPYADDLRVVLKDVDSRAALEWA